jgi:hypothetical protein
VNTLPLIDAVSVAWSITPPFELKLIAGGGLQLALMLAEAEELVQPSPTCSAIEYTPALSGLKHATDPS